LKFEMIGVSMIEPIRLGHQAAHAGKLLHLAGRTTGAGTRHHVDGVHLLLAAVSSNWTA
jgi:hypothetical protein